MFVNKILEVKTKEVVRMEAQNLQREEEADAHRQCKELMWMLIETKYKKEPWKCLRHLCRNWKLEHQLDF